MTFSQVQVLSNTASDHPTIGQIRSMPRKVGHITDDNNWLVNPAFRRSLWKRDAKGEELGFSRHNQTDFGS